MKKIFTFFIALAVIAVINAQKKVAYVTMIKSSIDAQAVTASNDPIIRLLTKDANFDVTVIAIPEANKAEALPAGTDLSTYDLVIGQEPFSSSSAIWLPGNGLALAGVGVPMIYNKAYALKAGRALIAGDTGEGLEAESTTQKYIVDATSNELFNGITLDGDNGFFPFNRPAQDDGSDGTRLKTINYGNNVVISGSTLLAHPLELKNTTDVATACINDMPAGATVGSVTLSARVIFIGMNYGAIIADADVATAVYDVNMTSAGLTLWRNAAYILTGQTVPSTPVNVETDLSGIISGYKGLSLDKGSVVAIEGGIQIEASGTVSVCSIDGKVIAQKVVDGTDFIACSKGIYIVKVDNSAVKVMVTE